MKKLLLSCTVLLITTAGVFAQKKSELFAEIAVLRTKLDSTQGIVSEARKNERISKLKAESFEGQVKELQEANATLLKNLNSFAEVSNKNSSAINQALGSLEQKEKQLKSINDAIASNDSTSIVVLTNAKQTLGENAKISVNNNAVILSADLETLFGNSSTTEVVSSAEEWLGKVANVLKANPDTAVTIEGLSMTGELNVAASQAGAVATLLQNKFEIDPTRMNTLGRDGNFKEGINLKIHPKFQQFYLMVKENMKNNN
jgi:outer membrane protein OmpA-like peptidoglycan-associated protein